jgi:hypothetical protein
LQYGGNYPEILKNMAGENGAVSLAQQLGENNKHRPEEKGKCLDLFCPSNVGRGFTLATPGNFI